MADTKISALPAASTPLAGAEVLPIVQSGTTKKVAVSNLTAGRPVAASSLALGGASGVTTLHITGTTTLGQLGVSSQSAVIFNPDISGNAVFWVKNNDGQLAVGTGANPYSGGTERFRFTDDGNLVPSVAAKGVNFTANTPAAGMTSQLLNWYEEGTWTPAIVGSGTAGTGTYSIQLGRYTRIGRVVNFTCQLAWSAHTGTGTMSVSGLPFTNTSTLPSQASIAAFNMAVTAGHYPIARVQVSSTSITLLESPTGGGAWAGIAIDTSVDALEITGSYII